MKKDRRKFLKKIAYSAPIVVSLGMLVEPTDASARSKPIGEDNSKSKVKIG